MYTNVNLAAPLGALALLGAAGLLLLILIVLVQSIVVRRWRRVKVFLFALAGVVAIYFVLLLGFSFASHEKILARGEEKHFCELDCHLAYSVVTSRQAKTLGEAANQVRAHGQFTIIMIRTRFDETTISPQRGNGSLTPNGRALTIIDEQGNRYAPAAQLGTALSTPLRPGDAYTTEVAFDLPANVKAIRLLLNEDAWETHLVIGHENSLLHKQTSFAI